MKTIHSTFLHAAFLLAATRALAAQEPTLEDRVLLNGGARVTNSRTVQVTVRLKSPAPPDREMALSTDPGPAGPWKRFVESQPFELPEKDGVKTVVVRLRDGQQVLPPLVAIIVLDTTPPVAKVTAPAQASGRALLLSSDVPDAVAMQWTEDVTRWGDWQPYSQPKEIELSPGAGPKTLLVRYRDEAGNVSSPATLHVEVGGTPIAPGVHQIHVITKPSANDRFPVTVTIDATGLRDMALQADEEQPRPREPFVAEKKLDLPKTGGAHRLRFRFRDDAGVETAAEIAFQESEVPSKPESATPETPPVDRRWSIAAMAGLLPHAVSFQATTPQGIRKINPDLLGMGRLELAFDVLDPLFAQAAFEYAGGGEVSLYSGTFDVGAHVWSTDLSGTRLGLDVEAGLIYSKLRVSVSDFGTFDAGLGFRAGVAARAALTDRWGLDAAVDYRDVSYDWGGSVVTGDHKARLRTAALLLGLSLKF